MECRSRRFQKGVERFTPSAAEFQKCLQSPERENKTEDESVGVWFCLRSLHAWMSTTNIFIGLWGICQTVSQCIPSCKRDEDRISSVASGLHVNSPSSVLFSSDSEEDSHSQDFQVEWNVDAIDDYEFPVVRFIDSVIYFFYLYRENYSAFVEELSTSCRNWGFRPTSHNNGRVAYYGHNINPKEKRPRFVEEGVRILKRRKLKSTMTRVFGDAHKRWIGRIAFTSRLGIFILQFLATNLPQAFKHNNDGFKFTPESTYGKLLDPLVNATFGGYMNWDANYFLHISVYGYTAENITAFFPLLPMILYIPSRVAYAILGPVVSMSSIVLILGVCTNLWLFVKCTETIYELAKTLKNSQQLITTACMMFCFNPASIFFTGLYTETLFAYLTSHVILSLCLKKPWKALIYAALSGICRSNGILNVGFIAAFSLQRELCKKDRPFRWLAFILRGVFMAVVSLIPFLLFQIYCVRQFCRENTLFDPKDVPMYCTVTPYRSSVPWPLPYSYVQKKYWNVGFLEYFQWKQLPNFMLAAPVLYLLGSESLKFMIASVIQMKAQMSLDGIYDVFQAGHGLFLTVFCFLFVHVQVSTRMIMSACPYLYLYLAYSHENEVERFRNREISLPTRSLVITMWCLLYYFVGTIGFSLGLPWT